jgi:hypothetical protein
VAEFTGILGLGWAGSRDEGERWVAQQGDGNRRALVVVAGDG